MQFIFVDFGVTLEIILYGVNQWHWRFVFGIEVKQTNRTLQFNKCFSEKFCILRGRIDNASVAFLKSMGISGRDWLANFKEEKLTSVKEDHRNKK